MNKQSINKQLGLSLIELMVAIVISSLLMAGTIQIFVNNKKTYQVQEAMSRLQENGRFGMQFLTRDIRMADFWGCVGSATQVNNTLNSAGAGYIDYASGGVSGTNDAGLNTSDTITIQGSYGNLGLTVDTPYMPLVSSSLHLSTPNTLQDDDIVMVCDCEACDIMQNTGNNTFSNGTLIHNTGVGVPGNATSNLSKKYKGDATVHLPHSITYSIKAGASGEPALFRDIDGTDQELVEGIQNMQIKYGEDTDGDGTANIYSDSGSVTEMDDVVSVRLTLTARTLEDNIALDTTVDSGRISRDFSSTITIRNRVN